MRKAVLWSVAVCVLCSGCSLASTAAHNVLRLPAQALEDFSEAVRNRQLADAAWSAVLATGGTYSEDHAAGFRDGFTDYLRAGGTGAPPTLPPRRYWKVRYQTPQGARTVADWFAGFRHGAAVAMASGYRQWVTIPVAGLTPELPSPSACPPAQPAPPWTAPGGPPQELPTPPAELAPPPQKAPGPEPKASLGQPLQPMAIPEAPAQAVRPSLGQPRAPLEPPPVPAEATLGIPVGWGQPVPGPEPDEPEEEDEEEDEPPDLTELLPGTAGINPAAR